MDFMTLDQAYYGNGLVEGYSSLIWTERHRTEGEFELRTPKIQETLNQLPEGCLVSIRESREVMMVETHSLGQTDQGAVELVTKGRSVETFLEKRTLQAEYWHTAWEMADVYTVQDAIFVILWNAVVNNTSIDATGAINVVHNANDVLPNVAISDGVVITDPPYYGRPDGAQNPAASDITDLQKMQPWMLEAGEVYAKVVEFLNMGNLGIRTLRPSHGTKKTVIIGTGADGQGAYGPLGKVNKYTDTSAANKLLFEVYNGRNRTTTPSTSDPQTPVIFRYDAGHIESPSYVLSNKDYRNVASVDWEYAVGGNAIVWEGPQNDAQPTGWDRWEVYVDTTVNVEEVDADKAVRQAGYSELKKRRRVSFMDGAAAPLSPYVYGVHYNLGDYVTMQGEFGTQQDMQVTEFIRTEDMSGDRGYPTLVIKE